MIGILVVTHGYFGKELINSLTMITGAQKKCEALSLRPEDEVTLLKEHVNEKIEEMDDGNGILILTDIIGGSPFNVCSSYLKNQNVEVLTGVNLPMLIEACELRDTKSLADMKKKLCIDTRNGIIVVRDEFHL